MCRNTFFPHVVVPLIFLLLFDAPYPCFTEAAQGYDNSLSLNSPGDLTPEVTSQGIENEIKNGLQGAEGAAASPFFYLPFILPVSQSKQQQQVAPTPSLPPQYSDLLWKIWLNSLRSGQQHQQQQQAGVQTIYRFPLKPQPQQSASAKKPEIKTIKFRIPFRRPQKPAHLKQNYRHLVQAAQGQSTETGENPTPTFDIETSSSSKKSQSTKKIFDGSSVSLKDVEDMTVKDALKALGPAEILIYLKNGNNKNQGNNQAQAQNQDETQGQMKKTHEFQFSLTSSGLGKSLFSTKSDGPTGVSVDPFWAQFGQLVKSRRRRAANRPGKVRRRRSSIKDDFKNNQKLMNMRGNMATVGTTNVAGDHTAVANANAHEGTRHEAKFAESNALAWRGGQEKANSGYAGIREWHPHGGICLHPPCKKVANSFVSVEERNAIAATWADPSVDFFKIAVVPVERMRGGRPGGVGTGMNNGAGTGNQGAGMNNGNGAGNQGAGMNNGAGTGNQGAGMNNGNGAGNQGAGMNNGAGAGGTGNGINNGAGAGGTGNGINNGNGAGDQGAGMNNGAGAGGTGNGINNGNGAGNQGAGMNNGAGAGGTGNGINNGAGAGGTGNGMNNGAGAGGTGNGINNGAGAGGTGNGINNGNGAGNQGAGMNNGAGAGGTGNGINNGAGAGGTGNGINNGAGAGGTGNGIGDGKGPGNTGNGIGDGKGPGDTGNGIGNGKGPGDTGNGIGDGKGPGDTGNGMNNGNGAGGTGTGMGNGNGPGNSGTPVNNGGLPGFNGIYLNMKWAGNGPTPFGPLPYRPIVWLQVLFAIYSEDEAASRYGRRWDMTYYDKSTWKTYTTEEIVRYQSAQDATAEDTAIDPGVEGLRPLYDAPLAPCPVPYIKDATLGSWKNSMGMGAGAGDTGINYGPMAGLSPQQIELLHEEELKTIKGTGNLAVSGTTSISGRHTAVSASDAQDTNHNVYSSASANAAVYRGGSESVAGGTADRKTFNRKQCLSGSCLTSEKKSKDDKDKDSKGEQTFQNAKAYAASDGTKLAFNGKGKGGITTGGLGNHKRLPVQRKGQGKSLYKVAQW